MNKPGHTLLVEKGVAPALGIFFVVHRYSPLTIAFVGDRSQTCLYTFSPSGSDALVEKVKQAAQTDDKFRIIMLDEHDIIAVGTDLSQAYNFADLAEEMAQIAYLAATIPGD